MIELLHVNDQIGLPVEIHYSFHEYRGFPIQIASLGPLICGLHFVHRDEYKQLLPKDWKSFPCIEKTEFSHLQALQYLNADGKRTLRCVTDGTNFQIKVWECLLQIEKGKISHYKAIAEKLGDPHASRAVGAAIGANKLALLIPCHRISYVDGSPSQFRWGNEVKKNILEWENSITQLNLFS